MSWQDHARIAMAISAHDDAETACFWERQQGRYNDDRRADRRFAAWQRRQQMCSHPADQRFIAMGSGYLNVPRELHELCADCGWDFGPAAPVTTP